MGMSNDYRLKSYSISAKIRSFTEDLEYAKPVVEKSCFRNRKPRYNNPYPTWRGYQKRELFLWKIGWLPQSEHDYNSREKGSIKRNEIDKLVRSLDDYKSSQPSVDIESLKTKPIRGKIKATWLGHSSVLVQFSCGINCLIDPIFSQRCSPVQLVGPLRNTKVPLTLQSLK